MNAEAAGGWRRWADRCGRALPLVLMMWAATGWVATVAARFRPSVAVQHRYAFWWHLDQENQRLRRLSNFLRHLDVLLPAGSRVVIVVPVPAEPPSDLLVRHQWMAYLLPRHNVVPSWSPLATTAQYWASFGGAGTPPAGATKIARWGPHSLFRTASAP